MSKAIPLTITEDERAELAALLDTYLAEARKDKGEHERIMARVDENLRQTKENLAQLEANRGTSPAERVCMLELQLQYQKEQQTAERENFRLQLENLMLRLQHGLSPGEQGD